MKAITLKTHHFHTKLPYQKPMLRQIEWWVQNGPITRNGVLLVINLYFWKFCFSLRTSYKDLIWCTNYSNAHIRTFCKRWSFIWRYFFPVSILEIKFHAPLTISAFLTNSLIDIHAFIKPSDITQRSAKFLFSYCSIKKRSPTITFTFNSWGVVQWCEKNSEQYILLIQELEFGNVNPLKPSGYSCRFIWVRMTFYYHKALKVNISLNDRSENKAEIMGVFNICIPWTLKLLEIQFN